MPLAARRAKTLSHDRSPCATQPCLRLVRLRKAQLTAADLPRRPNPRVCVVAPGLSRLRLHANPRSAFLHLPHAAPRSTRRPVLHVHPSRGLRDSTCLGPAARPTRRKRNFVLTAVALRVLPFNRQLASGCGCRDLNLKSSVGRRNCFPTSNTNRRAGISLPANQVNIAAEKFGAEIRNSDLRAGAAVDYDELQWITPITRLTTCGSRSHAPEVNTGTKIARTKFVSDELISLDHFSIGDEEG